MKGLEDGHTEIAYKNGTFDVLRYEKLEMYIHAQRAGSSSTENYDVSAVIRVGNDQLENYYEIELPLILSSDLPENSSSDVAAEVVWPEENFVDLALDELVKTKTLRDANQSYDSQAKYTRTVGKYKISVRGNPVLSKVSTLVLGVRNPEDSSGFGGQDKSACVWFNEMRVTGYKNQIGYATRGSVSMQLADLGNIRASTEISTAGWGDIESTVSELQREDKINYTVSTNMAMDKFIPGKTGIKLPVYASYDQTLIIPQYDPHQADVLLEESSSNKVGEEKENFDNTTTYQKTKRDINLTNVRKEKTKPDAKNHFYDISNLNVSVGYSDDVRSGIGGDDAVVGNNLSSYTSQRYKGALGYRYTFKPLTFQPLKKAKFIKSKSLRLIKDFNINFMPSNVSFSSELNRSYTKIQLLNDEYTTLGVLPTYEKRFTFDRRYTLSWPITKSINLNYSASANALVDEPDGDKFGDGNISQQEYRDSLYKNLMDFGRLKNYEQKIDVKYNIPINKIPLFDWTRADVAYETGYRWTAGPIGYEDKNGEALGNLLGNSRELTMNGKVDFVKLYNKSKYLKSVNSPRRKSRLTKRPEPKKVEGDSLEKPKLELGKTVPVRSLARLLMMVRDVNGRYTINHSTSVPGFMSTPQYFGLDFDQNAFFAPGVPFMLGEQDLTFFKDEAVENDWLTRSPYQNDPLMQNMKKNLSLKATVEPFNKFRINVDLKRTENTTYNEIFRVDTATNGFRTIDSYVNGDVEMTFLSFRTIFDQIGENNVSANFTNFENNRVIIKNRLAAENGVLESDYGNYHQDVLVPTFLATYTGVDPNKSSLKKLPKIPMPNWKLTYSGLSSMKALKKKFRSVTLSHGYSSRLKVPSYTSSAEYDEFYDNQFYFGSLNQDIDQDFVQADDSLAKLVPYYLLNEISITERFSPLLGINLKTKKNMSFDISYDKSRTLSLVNNQLNEIGTDEVKFSIGYVKRGGTNLPGFTKRWGKGGKAVHLKNDVSYKMNFAVKDTRQNQRILDGAQVTTSGNLNLRFQPNVSYQYSDHLNFQLYFDYNLNSPKVSTSFKRSTTSLGVKLTFKL